MVRTVAARGCQKTPSIILARGYSYSVCVARANVRARPNLHTKARDVGTVSQILFTLSVKRGGKGLTHFRPWMEPGRPAEARGDQDL